MNWKNLFIFMLVMIPSLIVLTRLLAWYFERLKNKRKPSVPQIPEKEVKPFSSYEEYLKELTGDGSLEDFLARCRAGTVPKRPEPEKIATLIARKRLEEIQRRMAAGPQGPLGAQMQSLPHQVTGLCGRCGKVGIRAADGTFPMCKCASTSPW